MVVAGLLMSTSRRALSQDARSDASREILLYA